MTLKHCLVLAALATTAWGQSTATGPPGAGTGAGSQTGPGSGAPGAGGQHPGDLDLPVAKPTYLGAPPEEPEPPIPPEIDPPSETPPPTFFGEEIDSENDTIVYVIDASGSMGGGRSSYTAADGTRDFGPRIDRAKAELIRSIQGLSENFKFNVISYSCQYREWQRSMQEATQSNKDAATSWVGGLRAVGSTGTGPATAAALSDRDNMSVVLLTDGAPNCGASGTSGHRRMISNANTQGATINVFGISASGSYRSFCQQVASDSGGSYIDLP